MSLLSDRGDMSMFIVPGKWHCGSDAVTQSRLGRPPATTMWESAVSMCDVSSEDGVRDISALGSHLPDGP